MPSAPSPQRSGPVGLIQERPLGELTSMQVGGNAEYFVAPRTVEQLRSATRWARESQLAISLLGGGTNVVVHDRGVPGLVIQPAMSGWKFDQQGSEIVATVGAAVPWDLWVAECVRRQWSGLECLSGIPGAVGATPVQNVGAYGQEVSQCIDAVEAYDLFRDCSETIEARHCQFGYRTSCFKTEKPARRIVTSVTFRLRTGPASPVRYGELSNLLEGTPRPSVGQIRQAVLTIRRRKSMLLDPADPNRRSCGSFFLNPLVTQAALDRVHATAQQRPPHYPSTEHKQSGASLKIPAAWLIEQAGFTKGQRFDTVGISSAHTLALVCHPGATASAVLDAARIIRRGVAETFGIELHPEPRFLGFGPSSSGLPPATSPLDSASIHPKA